MYSEEELLEALKQCDEKYNSVKTTLLNQDDDFPSASVYYSRFGSLESALKKAGLQNTLTKGVGRKRKYSDDKLLNLLKEFESKHNAVSHQKMRQHSGYPEPSLYNIRFDSLREACDKAGVEYDGKPVYDEQEALDYLQYLEEKYGETSPETINSDDEGPSVGYYNRFGGIVEARELAGLNKTNYSISYTQEEALDCLRKCKKEMGDTKTDTVNQFDGCPSTAVYDRLFGNIQTARKEAGIEKDWTKNLSELFDGDIPKFDNSRDFHTYCLSVTFEEDEYYYVGKSEKVKKRLRTHGQGYEKKVLPQVNKTIMFEECNKISIEDVRGHTVPENRDIEEYSRFKEKQMAYDVARKNDTNNIFGP